MHDDHPRLVTIPGGYAFGGGRLLRGRGKRLGLPSSICGLQGLFLGKIINKPSDAARRQLHTIVGDAALKIKINYFNTGKNSTSTYQFKNVI